MRTSARTAVITLVVASAAMLSAAPAAAAPAPVAPAPGSGPSATATFDPAAGAAAVDLVEAAAEPAAGRASGAQESAVRASVRQRLELLPGLDAGHLAQILKNLDQGAL